MFFVVWSTSTRVSVMCTKIVQSTSVPRLSHVSVISRTLYCHGAKDGTVLGAVCGYCPMHVHTLLPACGWDVISHTQITSPSVMNSIGN